MVATQSGDGRFKFCPMVHVPVAQWLEHPVYARFAPDTRKVGGSSPLGYTVTTTYHPNTWYGFTRHDAAVVEKPQGIVTVVANTGSSSLDGVSGSRGNAPRGPHRGSTSRGLAVSVRSLAPALRLLRNLTPRRQLGLASPRGTKQANQLHIPTLAEPKIGMLDQLSSGQLGMKLSRNCAGASSLRTEPDSILMLLTLTASGTAVFTETNMPTRWI